ncbi:MAG: MFS transporter [Candidatus Hodarchaeota archaeon]
MTEDTMAVEISTGKKLVYGMGYIGTQLFNGIQAAVTAWFWLNIMKLDNYIYSIIMLIFYNIWNALNDPIFGWISDKTRTKWGRRIPFIRIFTPIWMFSTIFLFYPFLSLDQIGLAIWFTIFLLLFDACYTMVAGCYNSLMPELTTLTTERTKISVISQIFSMIGVTASFIFPLLFKNNLVMFFLFIIIASVISMAVLLIPSFIIRERRLYEEEESLGLGKALGESIKNRPFMTFCGWNFMQQFMSSIIIANVIFYATHVLRTSSIGSILLFVAIFIPLFPGFMLWVRLSKKIGVKATVFYSALFIVIGLIILFLTGSDYIFSLITLGIIGIGLAGPLIFTNVMIAECTDWDELRTHQRREAMYFGTNALFTKPAIGVAQAVIAITLATSGFIPDLIDPFGNVINIPQSPSAILGIRMIMGLFPAIAMIVGLIFLWIYPLNLEKTREMKEKLKKLHKN